VEEWGRKDERGRFDGREEREARGRRDGVDLRENWKMEAEGGRRDKEEAGGTERRP
jgi:hypothetical protein